MLSRRAGTQSDGEGRTRATRGLFSRLTAEARTGRLSDVTFAIQHRVERYGVGRRSNAIKELFRQIKPDVVDTMRAGRQRTFRSRLRQDKGHANEWQAYANAISSGGAAPISFEELVNVSLACFRLLDSMRVRQRLSIRPEEHYSFEA